MKKFLIPIDFSETSLNAARYAIALVEGLANSHLIFYHVYSRITLATLSSKDEGSRQKVSEQALEDIKKELNPSGSLFISCIAEEGDFIENLNDYVLGNKVDMIIMGITGSSRIKQVFMGTNTLNVIRSVNCPVMIIPPDATFHGIKTIVFTSDFKDVARTHPFDSIKKVLTFFHPVLQILNIDEEHYVELTDEYKVEKKSMEDNLGEFHPEYAFLRSYDFMDGINEFVESRNIDAILTLPRKQGLISQLFKTSHTKKLAYHSKIPIIAIPS